MTRPDIDPNVELQIRADLVELHLELVRYDLVVWTQGNVSARIPGSDHFLIKGSGISYDAIGPESMVLCDADGRVAEDTRVTPSSDTEAHAYVYRNMADVGGVVHTHSAFATSFAAVSRPVPCIITGIADEFGGEIPVGPAARVGDDSIGRSIVDTLTGHRSSAMILARHGVFTIGKDARSAVKAAVLAEDSARTVHRAFTLGDVPPELEADEIDALYARYKNVYGQRSS